MRLRRTVASALLTYEAAAFQNTSPFILLSTSLIPNTKLPSSQLASSSSISSTALSILDACPSDSYVIVSQPHVVASDFSKHAAPYLHRWLNGTGSGVATSWIMPEVIGEVDSEVLVRRLQTKCHADLLKVDASTGLIPTEVKIPKIIKIDFENPPKHMPGRVAKLEEYDSFLHAVISSLPEQSSHTIIYTTTPPSHRVFQPDSAPIYEMDSSPYDGALHSDLRRDTLPHHQRDDSSNSNLPLFDTYLYLNPAIFMGLSVAVILFLILYAGINAVSSPQVSYFAFSKEMGPQGGQGGRKGQ